MVEKEEANDAEVDKGDYGSGDGEISRSRAENERNTTTRAAHLS